MNGYDYKNDSEYKIQDYPEWQSGRARRFMALGHWLPVCSMLDR